MIFTVLGNRIAAFRISSFALRTLFATGIFTSTSESVLYIHYPSVTKDCPADAVKTFSNRTAPPLPGFTNLC